MTIKKASEIPTIDVNLVTIQEEGEGKDEYILDTASQIQVEPQIEEEDGVKLVVKGVLKAQKLGTQTLTGNQITLTDNVFTPELVQMLQGGSLTTGVRMNFDKDGLSKFAIPLNWKCTLADIKKQGAA